MVWGAKMPLKINQKISEILDAFLMRKLEWEMGGGVSPHGARNSEFAY